MKNLANPLEWLEPQDNDDDYEAPLNTGLGSYFISKIFGQYEPFLGDNDGGCEWSGHYCQTLEAAKAACQQHYAESLWDNLSPRAKVALSIGMATLAQLGVTDDTLEDIIQKQNP